MSVHKRISAAGRVSWQVRWSESGRGSAQRSRTFGARRDAQLFEAELRRAAQLGAHAPVEPSADRLGAWLDSWLARGKTEWARTTYVGRRSHVATWIAPRLRDVRMRDLGAARLLEWRDEIRSDGCNAKQANAVMRTLSAALAAAVDAGKLPSNPAAGIKRLPTDTVRRDALSADEAERIRMALPSQRDRVLWGLLCLAGLRTEEALALRWRDIIGLTRTGGTIAVDRVFVAGEIREQTKTGAGRDVEIIAPLAEDLLWHYEQSAPRSGDELVCPSQAGTPVHLDNWRNRVFNPAAESAGVSWATPYTGRRTYVSLMIHAGVSPVMVAAAVGHTSGETIWRHYARTFDRARRAPAVPMADAVMAARARVRENGLPVVFPRDNVVKLRPAESGG